MSKKTAREAMWCIKESSGKSLMMIPLMVEFLIKHFEAGKGLDDNLEMDG